MRTREASHRLVLIALAAAVLATGCAGARTVVTADTSRYPISFSQGVRDSTGRLWTAGEMIPVGKLLIDYTATGLGYSYGTIGARRDISNQVNAQVSRAGGEAVVNLWVEVKPNCNFLNGFGLFSWLPFWPGCTPVVIRGDIVKRNPLLMSTPHPPLPVAQH